MCTYTHECSKMNSTYPTSTIPYPIIISLKIWSAGSFLFLLDETSPSVILII